MPQRDPCTGRPVPDLLGFKLTPCGAALRTPPVCPLGRPSGIPAKLDVSSGSPPRKTVGTGVRCLCGTVQAWERSKGKHASHPANVALLSFVVQAVLPPPCWDLEFSHS